MKFSVYLYVALLVFSSGCFPTVYAQDKAHSAVGTVSADNMADGEIKKIDRDNKKMTIKHGDIKSLDMPGMTMVFTAKDKGLLANVKPGDKIRFMAVNEGGKMVVTDIQPAQ